MEVCVTRNDSAKGSSEDTLSPTHYSSGDLYLSDHNTRLTDCLNKEDLKISTSDANLSPGKNGIDNVEKGDSTKDSDESKSSNSTSENCFGKCVMLPPLGELQSSGDGLLVGEKQDIDNAAEVSEVNGDTKFVDHCNSQSIELPTPLKLVSAMKGSRDKPKNLSVTWAPDVYDPIPTSVSHVPSNKNQRYYKNGKKYGKNKQKGSGKSSRGSKGKEKKLPKKNTGSSTKKSNNPHDHIAVNCFNDPQMGFLDFNIETSDPFCRSSFLKKSVKSCVFQSQRLHDCGF